MRDIAQLRRNLLHSEFTAGHDIFCAARLVNISATEAAGMAYKAGRHDGKEEASHEIGRLHKLLQQAQNRIAVLEASNSFTEQIATLCANPEPNRELPEIENNSPTSGDKTEDKNNG